MKEYLIDKELLNKYIKLTRFPNAFYIIKDNYIIKTIKFIYYY